MYIQLFESQFSTKSGEQRYQRVCKTLNGFNTF